MRPKGALSLARALSKLGVASRREATRWIEAGRVLVNGRDERNPLRWIDPRHDHLSVDGRAITDRTDTVVIAFHKPVGCVTTRSDPAGRPTVYDTLGDVGAWVFPVGRLDRDSSGLLIFTNDHRLGERLTSPQQHVAKTYHVRVNGAPDAQALRALREGLPLDERTFTRRARVRVLGSGRGSTWLEVALTEGKNRQIRRMCAAVGHQVLDLVRVGIGGLGIRGLSAGEWRRLTADEVERLTRSPRVRATRP